LKLAESLIQVEQTESFKGNYLTCCVCIVINASRLPGSPTRKTRNCTAEWRRHCHFDMDRFFILLSEVVLLSIWEAYFDEVTNKLDSFQSKRDQVDIERGILFREQ